MSGPEQPDPVSDAVMAMFEGGHVTCRVWAEQEEGPYRRDRPPLRRDVVEDRAGVPLALGVRLLDPDGAAVLGAEVEIWHCDAAGRYSGFPPPNSSVVVTAATAPRAEYLPDQTFLRGRQPADAAGMVEFRTIYPGWYPGRTVHIHVLVRTGGAVLTSQLYFPQSVTDDVFASAPYRDRPGRDTTNATDEIFPTGGEAAVVDIEPTTRGCIAGACLVLPAGRA